MLGVQVLYRLSHEPHEKMGCTAAKLRAMKAGKDSCGHILVFGCFSRLFSARLQYRCWSTSKLFFATVQAQTRQEGK